MFLSSPLKIRYHSLEEEIAFEPGCWLWDYLRRSGASRFLLPLSGGVDSSSVVAICWLHVPAHSKRSVFALYIGSAPVVWLVIIESSTKWCRYHHLLHIMSELNKPTTFGWCRYSWLQYSWLDSFGGGGLIIVLAAISC